MTADRRLLPARDDLAAAHLQGTVEAERYAEGQAYRVAAATASLRRSADLKAALETELLYGEPFTVYDIDGEWAWGQSGMDDYVGYIPAAALTRTDLTWRASHRVRTLGSNFYAEPKLKSPPLGALPFGARVAVDDQQTGFARVGPNRWVPLPHLAPLSMSARDWVMIAERFAGVPYVWGGRSSAGLDCSALIQLARQAGGHDCPRDSDMQEAGLGETLDPDAPLKRGDLVFWRGHVGVMRDAKTLLHANGYHMAVANEPLNGAIARILSAGDGMVTRRARLDP